MDISGEELRVLMENAVKNLHMNACPPVKGKDSYCYQDEDGIIHMGDETGFHCMMGQDFFEALLKMKDLPPTQQYISAKEKPYKQAKPWYRKERW